MRRRAHLVPLMTTALLALAACDATDTQAPLAPDTAVKAQAFRNAVPEDSPGPPYYSPLGNGLAAHDGEWAAIPFLREISCVDPTANLFVPYGPAMGCTLTVRGHERWQDGKWDDGLPWDGIAPRQTQYIGLGAVPVVFVHWAELEPELADGVILLPELMALPSLVTGTASFYKETDILGLSGPHGIGNGSYTIDARGALDAGGAFRLLVNEVKGELVQVRIEMF
ncbi:MAG: hypothetical protein P8177_05305 [Gemmatimonadota bacterium]